MAWERGFVKSYQREAVVIQQEGKDKRETRGKCGWFKEIKMKGGLKWKGDQRSKGRRSGHRVKRG